MTIKVSKPSINLREALSDLKQDTGLKGQELMRADTVAEARTAIGAGRKNLIINGGFDVWQRGTSGNKSGNGYGGYLSADRWASYYDGTNLSQVSATINSLPQYALRITSTTGNAIYSYQKVEKGSSIVSGKTITFSYWARASTPMQLSREFRFYDSATQNTIVQIEPPSFPITTSWQKFTETRILTDTYLNNTRDLYVLFFVPTADMSTGDYIEITNVQLELGSVATEFEHRSYGEELALCQRYYQKSYDINTYTGSTSSNGAEDLYGSADSTNILAKIYYPVHTRNNTPTITIYNPNNSGNAGTAYIISTGGAAHYTPTVNNIATSGFRCYAPRTGSAWTAHRMIFHWTVDNEL
jgi:hypothetical protein